MKFFYITVVVLCAFVSFAFSLDCYKCENCWPGQLSFLHDINTCPDPLIGFDPRCVKLVDEDGIITRGCSTSVDCAAAELFFECSSKHTKGCGTCCETDKCNAGSVASSCIAVCLASLLLFFLFFTG